MVSLDITSNLYIRRLNIDKKGDELFRYIKSIHFQIQCIRIIDYLPNMSYGSAYEG